MITTSLQVLLILLAHLVILVNTTFTLWPEMVVYPYLLNNGFVNYQDVVNPYPPLLPEFLSLFTKVFGYNPSNFQVLTWTIILVLDLLLFSLTYKIYKKLKAAFLSTVFFIIFSIPFLINGLWFDLIQTPFIVTSIYFFYLFQRSEKIKDLIFSSSFLICAVFIKQQAVWLLGFFFILIFLKHRQNLGKNLFVLLFPFAVFSLVHIFIFIANENLDKFSYWVFYFPFFEASKLPGYVLLPSKRQMLTLITLFLLFTPILISRNLKEKYFVKSAVILLLFAYPRFDYFHLIPSLSVFSLAFYKNIVEFKKSRFLIKSLVFLSLILLLLFSFRYLKMHSNQKIRFFEDDIYVVASFLKLTTKPDDLIYIQNGPDQILPLSSRLPPKPWVDEFPWYLEGNNLQQTIVKNIETTEPKFVIFKPYNNEGIYQIGSYRPRTIADYLDKNYESKQKLTEEITVKFKKQ